MANKFRYRKGDTKPRESKAVASSTVIEIGDLVQISSGTISAAADHAWNTNIATTQEEFHDLFAGVAMQASRNGDTGTIVYATGGVFEFDCAAATFEVGDLVGVAKQSGNGIESQKVVAVATANLAIGRVAKRYASNTTRVEVQVMSVLQDGGAYAPA